MLLYRVALLLAALLAIPLVVVCAFFFLPAPVAERTLLHSMERETPSVDSDLAPFSGCNELHARSGMPARASGCARLRDVLGLFDY